MSDKIPDDLYFFEDWLERHTSGRILCGNVKYRRADLPPTLEQALAVPEVKALVEAAGFLCDRLSGFEVSDDAHEMARDYLGHVDPAAARLKHALAALEGKP